MSLAYSKVKDFPVVKGGTKKRIYTITFDASYAAGGYTITPSSVHLTHIYNVVGSVPGFVPVWIASTGKLALYIEAGSAGLLAEAGTNQANLTGVVGTFTIEGY